MDEDDVREVPPPKKCQTDISYFFGGSAKKKKSNDCVTNEDNSPTYSTSTVRRKLVLSTAEKWITSSLAKYCADEWLLIIENDEDKGFVKALKCKTCSEFHDRIVSMKGFAPQWSGSGSTRLLHAAAIEHANSYAHGKSFDMYMKSKGLDATERTNIMQDLLSENKQNDILVGISTMKKNDLEFTKKKFDIAYLVAKEEMPVIKYNSILALEERHGVKLGTAYKNENTAGTFMDYISKRLSKDLESKIDKVNFYSILTDGSTDSAIKENEGVFVSYLNPDPPGLDQIKVSSKEIEARALEKVLKSKSYQLETAHTKDEIATNLEFFNVHNDKVQQE